MIGWTYSTEEEPQLPPRKLNGGLFTGQPFMEGAPWANVPITPTSESLSEMIPNKMAKYHYPSMIRPGNNSDPTPGIVICNGIPAITNSD
jgi:hypothetical protein